MSRMRSVVAIIAGLSLLALAGCPFASGPPPINVAAGLLGEYVVTNAARPAGMAFLDDGRVFYTEKDTGKIRVIVAGELQEQAFAELPVNNAGDCGLLGIAFHPDFNVNRRLYVFYSRSDTGAVTSNPVAIVDHRVVYFEVSGNVATAAESFVTSIPADGDGRRVGGRIAFGDDRTLYVAVGDLGNPDAAQDGSTLAGKVLRYTADGAIPADNYDPASPIHGYGVRDPQGLGLDPVSKNLFFTDRNETGDQEINRVRPGGNYGWPTVIGPANTTAEQAFVTANPSYIDPSFVASGEPLVGVAFNPSTKYGPDLQYRLFHAAPFDGRIYGAQLTVTRDAITGRESFVQSLPPEVTDVAFTSAGTLYVATSGAILRIVPYFSY